LLNAESPVNYPRDLFEQQVEGVVVLRLYVTADGKVVPESTRIAEASGYPELDSAALTGVELMRFAPARRNGQPVGSAFLQPVHFRQPDRGERGAGR
jgi:TonB family protein